LRLAIADEHQHPLHEEIVAAVAAAADEAGIHAERLTDPQREQEFDVLLLLGYPHFYPSFLDEPILARRMCWFGENLPHRPASVAERLARALPSARMLDVLHDTFGRISGRPARDTILAWREKAAVEREFGRNLAELRRAHEWVEELAVPSANRVAGARLAGWEARQVPFGYHAAMCGPLVPADAPGRDIDVLFLGRDVNARGRRARWLELFQRQIGDGVKVVVVDRGLYGAERHALLARTRIVVDIHRVPFNSTGMRFLLVTAGGAALVNEETFDVWLPRPEEHIVEAPREGLAAAVLSLLDDEDRRRRLVDASQNLLRTELSMGKCLTRVLGLER